MQIIHPNEPIAYENQEPRYYRAKLTHCRKGGVELSVCVPEMRVSNDPLPPGYFPPEQEMTDEERAYRDAANARRAARHARQSLRTLLKTMDASYLWTLTFRDNVDDIKTVQKVYQKFMREFRVRYPETKFLCVPERHSENRTSWHLHVAVADRLDVNWVRRCWWMALGHKVEIRYVTESGRTKKKLIAFVKEGAEWVECLPSEIRGNVDVKEHSKKWGNNSTEWDASRLASYLAKYMEKTFEQAEKSARRFWPSKDIPRPSVERFWLLATNIEDAIIEASNIVKVMYGSARLQIFLSRDYLSLWVAGTGSECPF